MSKARGTKRTNKFPKRDNKNSGRRPSGRRLVTQDKLEFDALEKLLNAFHAKPPRNDRWVYIVHYVEGSPMAALMITPTKAGDD